MDIEQIRTQFEQSLNARDKQLLTVQKELLKAKKANTTLKEENSKLQANIHMKEMAIMQLEKERNEIRTSEMATSLDASNYKREAQVYDEFLKSNLAKSDFFVRTIQKLETELRNKLDQINELDKNNVVLNNENASFQSFDTHFHIKEEIYKSTISKLFEDMKNLNEMFIVRTTDLGYQIEAKERENERIKNNEEKLLDKISLLEASVKNLTEDKELDRQGLENAIKLSETISNNRKIEIEKLQEELRVRNAAFEERDKRMLETFQNKDQQINSLIQEVHELKLAMIEKDAQITRLTEENRRAKVRETLLNQGLEEFGAQREAFDSLSREDLIDRLGQTTEALGLANGEVSKLQIQIGDIKKQLAHNIPMLLDKEAQYSKASEENENLRVRLEKIMKETEKVYKEKVHAEKELKRIRDLSVGENFDTAFLSNQVTKLLIQNNKLKLALTNGTGGESVEQILIADLEPSTSVFYNDVEDLKNKYAIILKRYKDMKAKGEKPKQQPKLPNFGAKRMFPVEEEEVYEEDYGRMEDEESGFGMRRDEGKEAIEKRRKLEEGLDLEGRAIRDAQAAVINKNNIEIADLQTKLRELEQQNIKLSQEISSFNVRKNQEEYQQKSQFLVAENNLRKAEDGENENKRLLLERQQLQNRILEKDRALNEMVGKVGKIQKENLDLQHKLNLTQKELNNRKNFEDTLNKAIEEARNGIMVEEKDLGQSLQVVKEENLLMKMKIENQAVLLKNYEDRVTNLQRLLNQVNKEYQAHSDKLNKIFFFDEEIKESYNSSIQEVFVLRSKLHELQELLDFYRRELQAQNIEYEGTFDKLEEMTGTITQNFVTLKEKIHEKENQIKKELSKLPNYENKVKELEGKVTTFLEEKEKQQEEAEEEEYEDTDWVHISEHQELKEKLKKEEENTLGYKNMVEELRDQLLHERETNLKHSSIQQQENEQVKQFIMEIDTLTSEKKRLEDTIAQLNETNEINLAQLALIQASFDREVESLTEENKRLQEDLNKLAENFGTAASENIENSGILALGQKNNLLNYLRERNSTLAFERDQLRSKLFALKKKIDALKAEKLQYISKLENELQGLRHKQELESVPQTSYLKVIIEENKTLQKENEKRKKLISEQEQQLKVIEQYRRDEAASSMEEEGDEDDLNADKILSLLERAKAQFEVLGKIEGKEQGDKA